MWGVLPGERRYRYHDLMGAYARGLLPDEDEAEGEAQARAFQWYWEGASYWSAGFNPQRRRQIVAQMREKSEFAGSSAEEQEVAFRQLALQWFEAERVNLLAAFARINKAENHDQVVSFAGNLGRFFEAGGYWQDWENTHFQALAAARISENLQGAGQTLNNLGLVYNSQGRWEDAIAQYEQSLEICRRLGDQHGEGATLNNLGLVYKSQGRWAEAIAQYEQSLEICRSLGDQHGEGQTLMNLGNLYSARVQYVKAIEYWQAAQTKLNPDSPAAKQIAQKLNNPYPTRQILTGSLVWLGVLIFAALNLLRGHWLIAVLSLLALALFYTYRIWKLRRGKNP